MAQKKPSDSTDLYFCTSVGFFTNRRKLHLQRLIGERANFAPPMLWAYAAVNQRNGDFSSYAYDDYQLIFGSMGLRLTRHSTRQVVNALKSTRFIEPDGKLHAWAKFNQFFSKARFRKAAEERWRKKRAAERAAAQPNGGAPGTSSTPNGAPGPKEPSKEIWLIDQALKTAKGKAKKDLQAKRERILSEHHGVNVSPPAPAAAPRSARRSSAVSPSDSRAQQLMMAQQKLQDTPDLLTETNVEYLIQAGVNLPADLRKKFSEVIERLEHENPVNA